MSDASAAVRCLSTYEWDAQFYGAFSSLSRLAMSVRNKANVIRVASAMRKANRGLRTMFDTVHAAMEGKSPTCENGEPPTTQRMLQVADELARCAHSIDYICESFSRVGLANNSLTAGQIRTLQGYYGPLLDLSDWLEVAAQPEQVEAIFRGADEEKARGELLDLQRAE